MECPSCRWSTRQQSAASPRQYAHHVPQRAFAACKLRLPAYPTRPSQLEQHKQRQQQELRYAKFRVCRAAASNSQEMQVVQIPQSQEEATAAAVAAFRAQASGLLSNSKAKSKSKKGFTSGGIGSTGRFSIELPVADQAAAGTVQVAGSIAKQLGSAASKLAVVYADAAAADLARRSAGGGQQVLSLQQACQQDSISAPLLLVAPAVADVALVEQLLEEVACGPLVLALNPGWSAGVPPQYQQLVESFNVVYSFLPVVIQGLLGGKEGAVLRSLQQGGSDDGWRILWRSGQQHVQVGRTKRRPTSDDLQLAFMNASAAASPLTKTVKFFKSLTAQK